MYLTMKRRKQRLKGYEKTSNHTRLKSVRKVKKSKTKTGDKKRSANLDTKFIILCLQRWPRAIYLDIIKRIKNRNYQARNEKSTSV